MPTGSYTDEGKLFRRAFFNNPEIAAIKQLFKRASHGLSFYGDTKAKAAEALKNLQSLNRFDQLLSLLSVFQLLATSNELEVLNAIPAANKAFTRHQQRMDVIYKYVEENYNASPDVNYLAEKVSLSTAAFCRYFKKQTKLTFTDFVNQYRINEAKNLLLQDKTITETCFATGFEQLSYFNKTLKNLREKTRRYLKEKFRVII